MPMTGLERDALLAGLTPSQRILFDYEFADIRWLRQAPEALEKAIRRIVSAEASRGKPPHGWFV